MNLKNISRVVGGEDSYTYSLLVRAILHLHVGIISLPLLRSIYNVFLRRDIHPYKVPSKYTQNFFNVLYIKRETSSEDSILHVCCFALIAGHPRWVVLTWYKTKPPRNPLYIQLGCFGTSLSFNVIVPTTKMTNEKSWNTSQN